MDYLAPDFGAAALVTIDTQVDTLDGEALEIPGTSDAVPRIAALAAAFRAARPIVHIMRLYLKDGSNVDLCRRAAVEEGTEILAPGSRGAQLAPGLVERPDSFTLDPDELLAGRVQEVGPGEVVIYKPRWGAFFDTPLDDHLRSLDVSTLVFSGCNFPNCPRTSVYEASERDYRIVLAEDAISGLYDRGREEIQGIGVRPMPNDEVVESLAHVRAPGAA
jgi:nicotinamidase-related amidase